MNIESVFVRRILRISIGICCILLTISPVLGAGFYLPITVNAAGYERIEKPVDVSVNFTQLLSGIGKSGTIDENSIRVVETSNTGTIIDTSVPFQFDKDPGYSSSSKASGTIVFIMKGTTSTNGNRYYRINFSLTGGSYSPISITPQVRLTDNVNDEGQSSYKINNIGSTFYFQKQAGGFSSWNDISGNDWISFNSGVEGIYRGIPNAGYPEEIFHPGSACCTSNIVSQGPIKIKTRSVSNDGKWESTWSFYPKYATMVMTKVGHDYWFLYEGTPGGVYEPTKDFMVKSDGVKTFLNQEWYSDIVNNEWVYFSDPTVARSLFVAHHEDDTLQDEYRPFQYMTVFGFGRREYPSTPLLSSAPQRFTIGIIDSIEFTQNSKLIYSAYKDLVVTKGSVVQDGGTGSTQLILLNVTYIHDNSSKAFSFFNVPTGVPSDLTSPVDYANGTLYQRLRVISKTSNKMVRYQFCVFQDEIVKEKHVCTDESKLTFTGTGIYYANQQMTSLFQYNNISWDRNLLKEMLVVKDKNGIPVDDRYGWNGLWDGSPDFNLYYPMKVYYTAIIVPPGGGQPIWPPDSNIDLSITSWSPLNNPTTVIGNPQTFSINLNNPANVVWSIDNSAVQSNSNVLTSSYTGSNVGIGIHNVGALATDGTASVTKDWVWTVSEQSLQTVYIPPSPIITYTTGNFWVNYTIRSDTGPGKNKTDSMNVSLDNGVVWQDGVTSGTNFNITIGPHGQSNISGVAHNNSGGISGVTTKDVQLSNNVPVQDLIGDKIITIGNELTFTIHATDIDGDTITYSKDDAKGNLDSTTGIYSWSPNNGDIGIYTVIISSSDGYGGVDSETIKITVTDGQPIVYIPPSPIITYTTGNFWINYTINPDTGPGKNKTDSFGVSLDNGVTWQDGISTNANFNITVGPHGQGNMLAEAYNDSGGASDVVTKSVQIDNNVPIQDPIGDRSITVGNELTFTVHATDADGDTITYSKDNVKGNLNSVTGVYSWIPNNGDIGINTVTINSSDGYGGTDSETIKITVTNSQPIEYMSPTPVNLVCAQGNFWIYCTWQPGTGNNTDSYNIGIDGAWSNDTTNNSINITTSPHVQKNISIYAKNNSGKGSLNTTSLSGNIKMSNNVPVQIDIGNKVVTIGQTLTFTISATDADGDIITYNTSATKGSYNSSNNTYSWSPNSSDVGSYTWSFCSNDNYGGSDCETVTITVNTNTGGNGGNGGGSSGGGGGGGGGSGGSSGENYYNVEFRYKSDLDINKDRVTSYVFDDKRSPIVFVNITGNSSNTDITGMVEALRNRSSLLKVSAPGNVYKNINIWIGTSGFVIPKNIKFPAMITFRVENSWIDKNSVLRDNVRLVRWDGNKWITLETSGKMKDSNYTYFDANVDGFTHFAIIDSKERKVDGREIDPAPVTSPNINQSDKPKVKQTATMKSNQEKAPGFGIGIGMIVFLIMYILKIRIYRK